MITMMMMVIIMDDDDDDNNDNNDNNDNYRVVSSLGGPPKPGYTGRKSSTLPSPAVNGSMSPGFTAFEAGLGEKTYSTDFSSRSDLSEKSFHHQVSCH